MKKVFNSALRCNRKVIALMHSFSRPSGKMPGGLLLAGIMLATVFFTGCKKELTTAAEEIPSASKNTAETEQNIVNTYTGLSAQTNWELQQARAASARYRDVKNAVKDGYKDISVVVENMGYHYMKMINVDLEFDPRNPEILVYNKNDKGILELVAVEYAVPIDMTPLNAPEGFTGSNDVWDRNTGFGLWLLHAWVWSYNPDGVFTATNPLVHLH